jgi:DNA-binding SARP family transcriptional activator/TolB-like protein
MGAFACCPGVGRIYWRRQPITASDLAQSSLGSTYRLETFGKLTLIGGATGNLSHQRRRLALLALLAASSERGMSRDQLIGYLWPDSSGENGRHSLEQLLHALRRALGESAFKGTNPVALDTGVIASDVNDFEHALARGDLTAAVELYAGPFLQGFYLDDAAEFERWATTERTRLANRYSETLTRLAAEAERARDNTGSIRWRRRQVEADPVSSRSALALMRALVASGDQTAALQHARIYEALVRQELESEPDPSIMSYVAALRSGDVVRTSNAQVDDAKPALPIETATPAQPVEESHVLVSAPPQPMPATSETAVRRRSRWLTVIPIAALVLIAVVVYNRNGRPTAGLDPDKIVIVPFRITGSDSSLNYLREGVVDLIAPMLTGEGGPVAVDSRTAISTWNRMTRGREGTADDARQVARELGAGLVLSGSVVETGGKLTITGSVISATTNDARGLTSVEGPTDSVDKVLDRFVGQLLVRQSGVAEASIAAITSQSLPAIRAYLDGRAAHRRADDVHAIESFARSLDIDSTFALAALDLAAATGKILRTEICRNTRCRVYSIVPGFSASVRDDDLFNRAVRLAWENRSKLGKRDRPLLDALRGQNYPRESSARETLANLERAVDAAPDRPETLHLLGILLLYQGPALGLSDSPERAEDAFRAASKLDSSYLAPQARIVEVAAFENDTAKLHRAGLQYLAHDSTGPTAEYVRWLVAAGTGDVTAQRAIRAGFRSLPQGTLDQIFVTSQMSGFQLDDADSAAALIIANVTDPVEKSIAFRRAQVLALNRGRPSHAAELLRRVGQLGLSDNARRFAIAAALYDDGDRPAADSAAQHMDLTLARDTVGIQLRDAVRQTSASMSVQSLWYLNNGDTAKARASTDWLRRHAQGQPRNRVLLVLPEMLMASRARSPAGAALRALVDSVLENGCCELPEFVSAVLVNAYEASGDERAALRVARRALWSQPPRMISTYLRAEGRLAARLGDRAEAIRAYEHYLALRSNPEPALQGQRDSVLSEVNRLKRSR